MALHEYGMLTWPEVEALARDRTIVLLPVGSVEQHGHHLPLTTDALVSSHLCKPLAELMPEMIWLALPPIIYGYAKHSEIFPGTMSLAGTTLSLLTRDILRGMFRQGFYKVVILNSHYENTDFVIEGASQALEGIMGARVLMVIWWEFVPDRVVKEIFGADWRGWSHEHGGLTETSLLLHCAPEVVYLDRMRDDRSPASVYKFRVLPWDRRNFTDSGTSLRLEGCSRERGAQLLSSFLDSAQVFLREQLGHSR